MQHLKKQKHPDKQMTTLKNLGSINQNLLSQNLEEPFPDGKSNGI